MASPRPLQCRIERVLCVMYRIVHRAGKPAVGLHLDVVKNGSVLQVCVVCVCVCVLFCLDLILCVSSPSRSY